MCKNPDGRFEDAFKLLWVLGSVPLEPGFQMKAPRLSSQIDAPAAD